MSKSGGGGGGLGMNKVVRETVRGGSGQTTPVDPRGLSAYGTAVGGKLKGTGSFTGENSALPVFEGNKTAATPMGNTLSASCPAGPGGGRTVHRSGMQGKH